ncbi:hypothetical protein PG996_008546 [Apiospora saccharicola]|uniref:Uncharacterized protein n=1 Tax=Apiospora saccharicola TaxID=335842 RepID=A0ABR1UY85_9PEZI
MVNGSLAQSGARRGPATFDRFPELPPELRFIVWEQAFLSLAKDLPRDWELTLRYAEEEDGGAVVVESDRMDTLPTHGPMRDRYIGNLRMANNESNHVFEKYCFMKVFTPAPCLEDSELRYGNGLVLLKRVWLAPEDQWMFNFEFNSIGDIDSDDEYPLPIFQEWMTELEECDHPTALQDSLAVLRSIRHLRVGFRALSGYTEHEIDLFLMSLPQLSRISIYLEGIPADQVPDRFETMVNRLDHSFENRHIAADCFFRVLAKYRFNNGFVRVPESATKDIVVPDKEVRKSRKYRDLRDFVFEDLKYAARPPPGILGLDRDDLRSFIDRWVALGERGIERVMVTRLTSTFAPKEFRRQPFQWRSPGAAGSIYAWPRS